jgi:hypothetical protein
MGGLYAKLSTIQARRGGKVQQPTGTHSQWLSRLLKELGHEVLVARAQEVELISKSNREDDRHDARTLARLARIDPELLGAGTASESESTNSSDDDPGTYGISGCTNRLGECGERIGEVLW